MKDFGTKLAQKRKELGMTQSEFADRLCVTRQTVGRWETGSVLPDIDKISDIASLLDVSCDYLLKDDVTKDTPAPQASVSRLLQAAVGRTIRLNFFDDEGDYDLFNKDVTILSFEGNWMKVSAKTKKGTIEKLIPLASVLSIDFVNEEEH